MHEISTVVKMDAQGRIRIPAPAREALGIEKGDALLEITIRPAGQSRIEDYLNFIKNFDYKAGQSAALDDYIKGVKNFDRSENLNSLRNELVHLLAYIDESKKADEIKETPTVKVK